VKRFKTIRFRFTMWTATFVALVLIVLGTYIYFSLQRTLYQTVDSDLKLAAESVLSVALEDGRLTANEPILANPRTALSRSRGISFKLINVQGEVLFEVGVHTPNLNPGDIASPAFQTYYNAELNTDVRTYGEPIMIGGEHVATVQVAQALNGVDEVMGRLLFALGFGVPLVVITAAIGSYLLVSRALEPIDAMTRTARIISASDLSARLNLPKTDDEVGRLAETFDDMLDRLESSFDRERRFLADASHELRTPLTAMQSILSVMREQRRTPEDYERALDDLSDVNARMRGLVERLLMLARSESPTAMAHEQVHLDELLCDICETMQPMAEQRGLSLRCQCDETLYVNGDTDALLRLFLNLIDNAIKYTEQGEITVLAHSAGKLARVQIIDTGKGIAAQDLPHIFDRFYRADPSRSEAGFGLGLSIVRDIARQHGGNVEVSSIAGKGTTFTVTLPRVSC
jgi:heavy metal sensor kinase